MRESIEVVIVGGGQAGLSMSHCLRERGIEHLILERRRVAERWRSDRWDSLRFQFPNWTLRFPGFAYRGADPHAFASRDEVASFIEAYAQRRSAFAMRCRGHLGHPQRERSVPSRLRRRRNRSPTRHLRDGPVPWLRGWAMRRRKGPERHVVDPIQPTESQRYYLRACAAGRLTVAQHAEVRACTIGRKSVVEKGVDRGLLEGDVIGRYSSQPACRSYSSN
jgi:glycine/D-amino acid oxidase-like deaminating enzyme